MTDIQVKEEVAIQKKNELEEEARGLIVFSQESADIAASLGRECKAFQKEIHDTFDPLCEAAHQAHKKLTSKRAELLKPFEALEAHLKGKILAWQREEQKRIDEENRKREAEARKAAEEEALKAIDSGDETAAEKAIEAAQNLFIAPVEKAGVAGGSIVSNWDVEAKDVLKVAAAAAAGVLPPGVIEINTSELRRLARAMGGEEFNKRYSKYGLLAYDKGSVRL